MSQISKKSAHHVGVRRKKLVGLTMGFLMFEPLAPALANGASSGAWMPMQSGAQQPHVHAMGSTGPISNSGHISSHNAFDIGKSQGTLQLLPHALLNKNLHQTTTIPIFTTPHSIRATTEVGQTGQNLSLDLTSASTSIILGSKLFNGQASVSITAGGAPEIFRPGATVTAAQYVAIQQVLSTGKQAIVIGANGAASGGDFSLNALGKNTVSLVVPASVTAIDTVTRGGNINLLGDLTNYGSIDAVAANSRVSSGTISALDITNASGATISATSTNPNFGLNLVAGNNISNSGTIKSTGDLNLSTGSGNIANSGLVSAGRNVNILSPNASADITINGTGGTISATAGDINVRDKSYNGAANINLNGGDYYSNNINMYSGSGAITGLVGQVSGNLNTNAGVEHFFADTSNLKLGNNKIDGDPTFASTGDLTIVGSNSYGQNVAILAQGNIVGDANAQIITTGNDITMIAGATVTTNGTTTVVTGTGREIAPGKTATADLGAPTGGSINLSASTQTAVLQTSPGSGKAGNITLVALANGTTGGTITLSKTSNIDLSSPDATSGNLTVIATANPASNATTVTLGNINATASNSGNAGKVAIYTGAVAASTVVFDSSGNITSGSIAPVSTSNTTFNTAGVSVGAINTQVTKTATTLTTPGGNGGAVTIIAGADVRVASVNTSGGDSTTAAGGNAGQVYMLTNKGGVTFGGGILASGGAGVSLGSGAPITVKGAGDITFNDTLDSTGKSAGTVTVAGNTITFNGNNTNIDGGSVLLTSAPRYVSSTYFQNADYADDANQQIAKITTGPVTVSSEIMSTGKISINAQSFTKNAFANVYTDSSAITVTESGSKNSITDGTSVTPAEYVALVQIATTGSQTLTLTGAPGHATATGGSLSLAAPNIPSVGFSDFAIPTGVTANLNVPVLNITNSALIGGILNLNSPSTQLNIRQDIAVSGQINLVGLQGAAIVAQGAINIGPAILLAGGANTTLSLISGGNMTLQSGIAAAPTNINVNLVAGANVTFLGDAASFTGASANGGILSIAGDVQTNGGNFTAVAYSSASNSSTGLIFVNGQINTGSTTNSSGNGSVLLISQLNGVQVTGAITASGINKSQYYGAGGNGGNVQIFSAQPVITGGTATISGGAFNASAFDPNNITQLGGIISVSTITTAGMGGTGGGAGTISAGGSGGAGGAIILEGGQITATGALEAFGGGGGGAATQNAGGNGGRGGSINVLATGNVNLNQDVNTSGGGGGGGGAGGGAAGLGGNAGNVSIFAGGTANIGGPIFAAGGGNSNASSGGGGSLGAGGGGAASSGGGSGTFGGGSSTSNSGGGGAGWGASGGGAAGWFNAFGAPAGGNGGMGDDPNASSGQGLGGAGISGGGDGGRGQPSGGDGGKSGTGVGNGQGTAGFQNGGSSGTSQPLFGQGGLSATSQGAYAGQAGQSGNGGQVSIAGVAVRVTGKVSSANTQFGGQSIIVGSNGGGISIVTQGTSVSGTLSSNADYSTTGRSTTALTISGSAPFTIGGTTGSYTAGTLVAPQIVINGTTTTNGLAQTISSSSIALGELSGIVAVSSSTALTPAEVASALQLPSGQTLILSNGAAVGGTLTLNSSQFPASGSFTNLVVPANVTVISPASLSYTGSGQINGILSISNNSTVTFGTTLGVAGALDFQGVGTVNAGGQITVNGGTIASTNNNQLYITSSGGGLSLTGNANVLGSVVATTANSISVAAGSKIEASADIIFHTASIVNNGQIIADYLNPAQGDGQILINNNNGGVTLSGSGQFVAPAVFSVISAGGDISTGTFLTAAQPISTNSLTLNAVGAITLDTNSIAVLQDSLGNGGTIAISGASLTNSAGTLALNADGKGTGSGGEIDFLFRTTDISVGSTGTVTASAHGGATSGDGGRINIQTDGNLTVDTTALDVSTQSGNGGTLNLSAGKVLTLNTNQLSVNGVNGGAGGNIFLSGDTIVTQTTGPLVLNASGDGVGAGGEIDYSTTSTANSIIVDSSATAGANAVSIYATGGNGGTVYISSGKDINYNSVDINPNGQGTGNGASVDVEAYTGAINFSTPSVHFDGLADGNGGSASFGAAKLAYPTNANFAISANAAQSGSGSGGSIDLFTTDTAPLVVGSGAGALLLSANSGTNVGGSGGNGGSVSLFIGGSLSVQSGGITVNAGPQGNGGQINLTVGQSATGGNLQIAGNLDVSGHGSGSVGGQINLESNSKTTFSIGLAKAVNGTQGILIANGVTSPGTITVQNKGAGGITQLQAFTSLNTLQLITHAGAVALNGSIASGVAKTIITTDSGKVSSSTKAIIAPLQIVVQSSTGAISLPNLQSALVAVSTGAKAAVAITNPSAKAVTVEGINGGTVTLKSLGNLDFAGPITGGNITITNTNKNGGTIALNSDITSMGILSVSTVGNITATGSINATKGVKFAATGANSIISQTATIGVGNTGSISVVAAKSTAANTIDFSGSELNGGKTITLTATKGSIITGTIGDATAPGVIKVTAANTIDNQGLTLATTSITEKTTASTIGNGISIEGAMEATLASKGVISLSAAGTGAKIFGGHGTDIGAGKSVTITAAKGAIDVYNIGASTIPLTTTLTAASLVQTDAVVNAVNTITEKATAANSSVVATGALNATSATGTVTITALGGATGGISVSNGISAAKSVTLTTTAGGMVVGDVATGVFKATTFSFFGEQFGSTIVGRTGVTIAATSKDNTAPIGIVLSSITTGTGATTAGGAISIKSAGVPIVLNGDANISANSGKSTKATVTIENALTTGSGGTILVSGGAQISTGGALGSNVILSIGAPPGSPKFGMPPAPTGVATYSVDGTVVTTPAATGPFYFGSGTTGTVNFLNATADPTALQINSMGGGKVIFSTGNLPAANITVNAGTAMVPTIITADPPLSQATLLPTKTAPALVLPATSTANDMSATLPVYASAGATVSSVANFNNVDTQPSNQPSTQLIDNQSTVASTRTLYGNATAGNAPFESIFIGNRGLHQLDIDAKIVSVGEQSQTLELKHGNMVLAPKQNTVVETPFGQVAVKAGAVALILVEARSTAVYNLHDDRLNSVVVTSGGEKTALSPGRHVMITSSRSADFSWVNPAEAFAYRNVSSKKCSKDLDLQAFTTEFSLVHALANVRQLKELVASKQPESRHIACKLLKTAAIVGQYGGRGNACQTSYQTYRHPQMTASAIH